ncbi:MAG: tetratricopeptide repeat protein [Halochromatium sp.]
MSVAVILVVRYQPATSEHMLVEQAHNEVIADADPEAETLDADADPEAETLDQAERNYRKGLELLRRSTYREGDEDGWSSYRTTLELLRRATYSEGGSTLPEAAKWFRQAAEDDHARAQLMLGVLHENGSGVIQDYEQALAWYRRAAMQGEPMAMYRVGAMLSHGIGADKDLVEAYAWCNIAAARGQQEAVIDRDRVAKLLSIEEIKEAQQQSRSFDQELPFRVAAPFALPAGL